MGPSSRPSVGLLLDDLGLSQLAYSAIKSANDLVERGVADVSLFFEGGSPACIRPRCPVFPEVHSIAFQGTLVATSLKTAAWLTRVPANIKRLYYCWDLEWLRLPPHAKQYELLAPLYRSASYELVARTKEQALLLSQVWNRRVQDVVPDCEIEGFLHV